MGDQENQAAKALREALDTNRRLMETMNQELTKFATCKVGLQKDLDHACETIDKLDEIVRGGNEDSLQTRIIRLEDNYGNLKEDRDINQKNIGLWVTSIIAVICSLIAATAVILGVIYK